MAINWKEIIEKAGQFGQKAVGKVREVTSAIGKEAKDTYKGLTQGGTIYIGGTPRPTEQIPMPPIQGKVPTPTPIPQEIQKIISPTVMASATPKPTYASTGQGRNPKYDKKIITSKVDDAIKKAAAKFDVPADLLYDLSFSESSHLADKVNPTRPDLNPTGLFQFTDATWYGGYDRNGRWVPGIIDQYARSPESSLYKVLPNEDRKDPYTNALAAAYLIKYGQLAKWDDSEWNWGDYWTPQELEDLGYYNQSLEHVKGKRYSELKRQMPTPMPPIGPSYAAYQR